MSAQSQHWNRLALHPLDAAVIDPNDTLGLKNRYIASLRNEVILGALRECPPGAVALDLGCGTGGLSAALVGGGWKVVGIDISSGLLSRTRERSLGDAALFVLYDGLSMPIADACVDAVTTYVVLNHVVEADHLAAVLSECFRVLKPGGKMICAEQVRRRSVLDRDGWKRQRTLREFLDAFERAGLRLLHQGVVRYGRFPTTPLVRLGLVPRRLFERLARAERAYGRWWGVPRFDYCDVLFELEKPAVGD
jgi:SAM-dependent methyltransferase